MIFFDKLAKIKKVYLFFPRHDIRFFRDTVSLKSAGFVETVDFSWRIPKSLSASRECAK
jgi:hypothetical protein